LKKGNGLGRSSFAVSAIVIETTPPQQDLTQISKPITQISQICSEGSDASDDRFQIFLFLVNGLGMLMRPEAVQPKDPGSWRDAAIPVWERSA
jgi:hypothetical protein